MPLPAAGRASDPIKTKTMFRRIPALAGWLLWSLLPLAAAASDLAKERRWADQIVEDLFDGEAVWLRAGGQRFLALHTPAAQPKGAVLLLHGIGVHPDWPQVIQPLRVGLPERGWTTLSLQMPILPNEAKAEDYAPLFPEVAPRLEAGLAFLRERGHRRIFIVAHSLGATMAVHYLAAQPRGGIAGLVAIGLGSRPAPAVLDSTRALARIRLPVLDLYGEEDLDFVLDSRAARARAAAGNPAYRQVQAGGADHFFTDREAELLDRVAAWLDRLAPAQPSP